MLGLGEQVGGAERGGGRLVGDHYSFARAVEGVDADLAEDGSFRQRDEDVAGAADLVDLGDAGCAVRKCSDRLRAAHAVDAIDASDVRRDELDRRHAAVFAGGRGDQHLFDSGDAGRDCGHQHGRRIDDSRARRVDADTAQRRRLDADAVAREALEYVPPLLFVEGTDAIGGEAEGFDDFRIDMIVGGAHLVLPYSKRGVGRAVERLAVAQERGVAVLPYVMQYLAHRFFDRRYIADGLSRALPNSVWQLGFAQRLAAQ